MSSASVCCHCFEVTRTLQQQHSAAHYYCHFLLLITVVFVLSDLAIILCFLRVVKQKDLCLPSSANVLCLHSLIHGWIGFQYS